MEQIRIFIWCFLMKKTRQLVFTRNQELSVYRWR
uniref:Uncharacterized protein n=1 Tax=Cucumis melo TaxID=3656 RepID=A0A9I9EG81_CUCME